MTKRQNIEPWVYLLQSIIDHVADCLDGISVTAFITYAEYHKMIKGAEKLVFSAGGDGEVIVVPKFTERVLASLSIARHGYADWNCEFFFDATTSKCWRRLDIYSDRIVARYMKSCNVNRTYITYGPAVSRSCYIERIRMVD